MVTTVNKSYDLSGCIGQVIGILFNCEELLAELVYANVTNGKLIIKNIRRVESDGSLSKWLVSVDDGVNFDIGLEQNKLFWEPSSSIKTAYDSEFPTA